MVLNFPNPYPDETFYSIVARYYDSFGTAGPKEHLYSLFSSNHQSATLDFPNNLKVFAQNTKSEYYTPERIINNHTLFPLYKRFLRENRIQLILKYFYAGDGNIHTTIGVNAGLSKSSRQPRYCSKCYENDLNKYGESYFRRSHQIPLIAICTQHKNQLEELLLSPETLNKHKFLSASQIPHLTSTRSKGTWNSQIQKIGERMISLLDPKEKHLFDLDIYFYKKKFQSLGFNKGENFIDLKKLYASFSDRFSQQTLRALKSEIKPNESKCWLKSIARKHRKSFDPIRHVLIEDFILAKTKANTTTDEFKNQKWPCLNPVCINKSKNVLSLFSEHYDQKAKKRILTIKCDCGFSYTESKDLANQPFRRVKTYGRLWEVELKKLLKKDISIRAIASQLNCDSKTVIHHMKNTGIDVKKRNPKVLLLKRKKWIQLKQKHSDLSISNLRSLQPALYTHLYKNDKNWLLTLKYPSGKKRTQYRVNWKSRDKDLGDRIYSKYHYLLSTGYKKRISKNILLKLASHEHTYYKNQSKLPISSRLLSKHEESIQEHQIRRVMMAIDTIKTQDLSLKAWRIYRIAGIRKKDITEKIERIVLQIVAHQTDSKLKTA
ncbi:MAG: TnsD family Tn7-like transposition protein [Reichenbachiella sp.]|uniref:TnsD family Tn7-like transposition protein n=1 Tax=Reichenbachiella sp. TaxID=2184521 RepID=UPI002966DF03|nr:TnsD family Tn7-like transposition protein [Reichenbachiella sp.]MDW3212182.1 TnsD family Tn7-like transposition protein [Reichenbachiella sp.]